MAHCSSCPLAALTAGSQYDLPLTSSSRAGQIGIHAWKTFRGLRNCRLEPRRRWMSAETGRRSLRRLGSGHHPDLHRLDLLIFGEAIRTLLPADAAVLISAMRQVVDPGIVVGVDEHFAGSHSLDNADH